MIAITQEMVERYIATRYHFSKEQYESLLELFKGMDRLWELSQENIRLKMTEHIFFLEKDFNKKALRVAFDKVKHKEEDEIIYVIRFDKGSYRLTFEEFFNYMPEEVRIELVYFLDLFS